MVEISVVYMHIYKHSLMHNPNNTKLIHLGCKKYKKGQSQSEAAVKGAIIMLFMIQTHTYNS